MIVAIRGGLGNQLFQAAFVQFLQQNSPHSVLVDIRDYPNHGRTFLLERCGFSFEVARPAACDQALWGTASSRSASLQKFLARVLPRQKEPGLIREPKKWRFDPELARLPANRYLDGLWMSTGYAKAVDFRIPLFQEPLPERLQPYAKALDREHSVAVHIRRGDYAHHPHIRRDYLVCEYEYFVRAMNHLAECLGTCSFFVFSDEPDSLGEQDWKGLPVQVIPSLPECGDEQILHLFSRAHHHILSNSTYSWWGAYFNQREGHRILVPDLWRRNLPTAELQGEFIPRSWTLFPTAPPGAGSA